MIKLKTLSRWNFYESSFKIAWFFTFSAKTSGCGLALNEPQIGVTNDHFHSVFVVIGFLKAKHPVSLKVVKKNKFIKPEQNN